MHEAGKGKVSGLIFKLYLEWVKRLIQACGEVRSIKCVELRRQQSPIQGTGSRQEETMRWKRTHQYGGFLKWKGTRPTVEIQTGSGQI